MEILLVVPTYAYVPAEKHMERCPAITHILTDFEFQEVGTVLADTVTADVEFETAVFVSTITAYNTFHTVVSFNQLTFTVLNACDTAFFENLSLNGMTVGQVDSFKTQTFETNVEGLTELYGYGICGDYNLRIVDEGEAQENFAWLDLTGETITVSPDLSTEVGVYNMQLERYITNNQFPSFQQINLRIVIAACIVDVINVDVSIEDFYYTIGSATVQEVFQFTQVPDCDYDIEYDAVFNLGGGDSDIDTGTPFSIDGQSFRVYSEDGEFADDTPYEIKLTATTEDGQTGSFIFEVTIVGDVADIPIPNENPVFIDLEEDPSLQFTQITQGEEWTLEYGSPSDLDGATEDLTITTTALPDFVEWDESRNEFTASGAVTEFASPGLFSWSLIVEDLDNGFSQYQISLLIVEFVEPVVADEGTTVEGGVEEIVVPEKTEINGDNMLFQGPTSDG